MPETKQTDLEPTGPGRTGTDAPGRIYRSRTNRKIGGVCGGLAEYFNMDPTVMRVVWVLLALLNGFGILAYIVCWIVIPENPLPSEKTTSEQTKSKNTGLIWGFFLLAIGLLFLFGELDVFDFRPFRWHWNPMWFGFGRFDLLLPIAIIIIGILYLVSISRKEKHTQATASQTQSGGTQLDKKLTRSVDDRMIGGVCGGLARYFNIDTSIVRVGWVLLTLFSSIFPGVIAYIIMLIIIPEESAAESGTGSASTTPTKSRPQKATTSTKSSSAKSKTKE